MKIAIRILAALIGTATMSLLLINGVAPVVAMAVGVTTGGGMLWAIPSSVSSKSIQGPREYQRLTDGGGEKDLKKLMLILSQLPQGDMRAQVERITTLAEQLVHATKQDVRDAQQLHSFFNHYLPSLVTILSGYLELSHKQHKPKELDTVLAKTEKSLTSVEEAFHKQVVHLLDNDMLDLDVEVTVLEKSLKMDGLIRHK